MEIAVYGIAKDEAKHVERFMASTAGADGVYICDTGSSDRTVELLEQHGAKVKSITVEPWRYDTARQISLDHVPEDVDICVCLDLDEVLLPGWREVIEREWEPGLTVLRYPFTTDWNEDGTPQVVIWGYKVHARHAYRWKYPIHEVIVPVGEDRQKVTQTPIMEHHQDRDKDRNRLSIFDTWMHEYSDDARMLHMYARELIKAKRYKDAEDQCRQYFLVAPQHVMIGDSTRQDAVVRSKTCRFMAACAGYLGRSADHILVWLLRSVAEAPWQREPWIRLGEFWLAAKDWAAAWAVLRRGHMITDRSLSITLEEDCWNERADKLLEIAWNRLQGSTQELRVYWNRCADGRNFGDLLTHWAFAQIGVNAPWVSPRIANVFGAGSIIETIPDRYEGVVLGTGIMHAETHKDLTQAKVLALRGRLTLERCKVQGKLVLGDLGLVIRCFLSERPEPEFDVGHIPHYAVYAETVQDTPGGELVIDVRAPVDHVIAQAMRCRRIKSSSLHGLVLADVLGIPSTWIKHDGVLGDGFKFHDYASAFDEEIEPDVWRMADQTKVQRKAEQLLALLKEAGCTTN